MDNLLLDIGTPDQIRRGCHGYPRRRRPCLLLAYAWKTRSGSRGILARFAVERALALLWNPCSVCRGISARFVSEYA
ncbi:hypothetical protein, partial [Paraburkholderia kururiensis]|uniref:hypothetical protein n=1 Tax=Paraburkholderia kururiensis TaxID=984307 RepID=UPI001F380EED